MTTSNKLSEKAKPISMKERGLMIAEAAYYRAEKRGFQGNGEDLLQDWLTAESEINEMLQGRLVSEV